jgi:hypothetical protein
VSSDPPDGALRHPAEVAAWRRRPDRHADETWA